MISIHDRQASINLSMILTDIFLINEMLAYTTIYKSFFTTGIGREEIISHHQWYLKYSYLKERQRQALEKWKTNKKLIKKVKTEVRVPQNTIYFSHWE